MKMIKMNLQRWWRLGLGLFGVVCVLWIAYSYFAPNGEFKYSYYFDREPSLISEFSPNGRALTREQNTANGEHYQRLVMDPIYFSVDLPSPYPEADITIEYQNPSQNIVQLGLKLDDDESAWNYMYQPLENKFVDESHWEKIETDEYILLQKESIYDTVDAFLTQPPTAAQVGTFLTNYQFPFIDPAYEASTAGTSINTVLRGQHELYTYIKDEPLELTVYYHDINYAVGPDPFTVTVSRLDNPTYTREWTDDGEEGITGTTHGERVAEVKLPDLVEGVYRIDLKANDDILITTIESAQHKLVFKGKLHLAGSSEYINTLPDINTAPTAVMSDADFITVIAKHQYGLGIIEFYNQPLDIRKENTPYQWTNPIPGYLHNFEVSRNDVEFISSGLFALDANSWFDPFFGFEALNQYSQPSQLDYVLSGHYTFPERIREWTIATATFDLTQAYRDDPTHLDFILSAAGLETAPQGMKVRAIHITARKEPITWQTLWPRLKKRLFN